MIVIINKGEVYEGLFFESYDIARNYVKWRHPKKKWKDVEPNMMKCKYTGMVMRFEELRPYKSIQHSQLEKSLRDHEPIIEQPMLRFDSDNYDRLQYQKDHL